jgi:hypothetical protein
MRSYTFILVLIALIGLLAVSRTESSHSITLAQPPQQTTPPNVKGTWKEFGMGRDKTEAVERALAKAASSVWLKMREWDPDFVWQPTLDYKVDYIRKHLMKGDPERNLAKEEEFNKDRDDKWQRWEVTVEISQSEYSTMCRHNELQVLSQNQAVRLALLAKLVGVLLAGCVLTLLYLRIEEKTKGYFSRLLLVGAVATLILVSAGLFLLLPWAW